mmetsp:Transcript_21876/g.65535  ORF Transcript_21876/g.65535 Transcript_21876/m.65535 type:complete len:257 (+) Transcript_21876:933-1703(+)
MVYDVTRGLRGNPPDRIVPGGLRQRTARCPAGELPQVSGQHAPRTRAHRLRRAPRRRVLQTMDPKLANEIREAEAAATAAQQKLEHLKAKATEQKLPELGDIVIPCFLGALTFGLYLVDYAVDLTGDPALIGAWYKNVKTLPICGKYLNVLMPLLSIPLVFKLVFSALPGLFKGKPGSVAACAPLVIVPVMMVSGDKAFAAIEASLFAPTEETLEGVKKLHAIRLFMSFTSFCMGVSEFSAKFHLAIAGLAAKKND